MSGRNCQLHRFSVVSSITPQTLASWIVLFVLSCYGGLASALDVVRGPYLQQNTPDSIIIKWRTDSPSDAAVRYGLTPTNLNQVQNDFQTDTDHSITLSGLTAATRYYYSVGNTSGSLEQGDASYFFETSPVADSETPIRLWVVGDSGTGNANAAAVRNAYEANYSGDQKADLMLMLGDNAYSNGTDSEYQTAMFDMYQDILRQTPVWPTIGNHDGPTTYLDIFELPTTAEAGGVPSGTEHYYSYDYGNIHFIVLDSEYTPRTPGSAMLNWLQSDLANTQKQWIIAYWHHPPYSKGSHNSDSNSETEIQQMRSNVLPILEQYGVDLVLTGHSHSYERSMLIDGHYGKSNTFSEHIHAIDNSDGNPDNGNTYTKPGTFSSANDGAVYAVAGSSGKVNGVGNHPVMVTALAKLGSMIIDINGRVLTARFLNSNGVIDDHFRLSKHVGAIPLLIESAVATHTSQVTVYYSESVNNTAVVTSNYQLSNGATVVAASLSADSRSVDLTTSSLSPNITYELTVNNVQSVDGAMIEPNTTITFSVPDQIFSQTFRQGHLPVTSYNGMTDSQIRSHSYANTNYGDITDLNVDGNTGGTEVEVVLRWDLSTIPAGATVTEAEIALEVFNRSVGDYYLYALKKPWSEHGVTWNSTGFNNWQTGGAKGSLDRTTQRAGTINATTAGTYTLALNDFGLSVVESWISDPSSNFGFVIGNPNNTDGLDFLSSEHTNVAQRPALTVSYQVVNDTIDITPIATQHNTENDVVSLQVYATDTDPAGGDLHYAISSLPSGYGMQIDSSTGAISGQLGYLAAGSHQVEVTVSNAIGASDTTSFTWEVQDRPILLQTANQQHSSNQAVSVDVAHFQPDNFSRLSLQATGLPPSLQAIYPGSSLDATIVGQLTDSDVGVHNVVITAIEEDDNGGINIVETRQFQWTVVAVDNVAPELNDLQLLSSNQLVLTFSEAVNNTASQPANYVLSNNATVLSAAVQTGAQSVVLNTSQLAAGTSYTLYVSNVEDLAGNPIANNTSWQFTTEAEVPPLTLESVTANSLSLITVSFSEAVDNSGIVTANYQLSNAATVITANLSANSDSVVLTTSALTPNTTYALTVSNVKSVAGATIAPNSSLSFLTPQPPNPDQTITETFRQGDQPSASYNGMTDSQIRSGRYANTNYGSITALNVDGSTSGSEVEVLLRWDLSSIPADATVTEAEIQLEVFNRSLGDFYVYALKKPWSEHGVTWNSTGSTNWQVAGAKGSLDRFTQSAGTINATSSGSYTLSLNDFGLSIVESWINDPSSNYGFIIGNRNNTDGLDFRSSEFSNTGHRPALTITYSVQTSSISINSVDPVTSTENDQVQIQIIATDSNPNGGALTYTATGIPRGYIGPEIDSQTGLINRVLGHSSAGNHTVTVTVSNSAGDSNSITFDWQVLDRPVLKNIADQVNYAGDVISLEALNFEIGYPWELYIEPENLPEPLDILNENSEFPQFLTGQLTSADVGVHNVNLVVMEESNTSGADYFVESHSFQWTILPQDTVAPTINSAVAINNSRIEVEFSEEIDSASVQPGHFTISSAATVAEAILQSDAKTVVLVTTEMTPGSHTLNISNVTDLAGNVIAASSSISFDVSANPPTLLSRSYRQGSLPNASYTGMSDTQIRSARYANTNYGNRSVINVDGSTTGNSQVQALLRWAIDDLPADAEITSAKIRLRIFNGSPGPYYIYALNRLWSESTVTWNAAGNTNWQLPGALGVADRDNTVLGSLSGHSTGLREFTLNAEGIAQLQSWVDSPESNHGFIISNPAVTNGLDFYSSESSVNRRPTLILEYLTQQY